MSDAQFDKLIGWLEGKFARIEARFDRLEARVSDLEGSMQSLRVEMNERFLSVNDRLSAVERLTEATAEGFQEMRAELSKVVQRLDRVDTSIYELNQKVNARDNLAELWDKAEDEREPVVIQRRGHEDMALLPAAELRSLRETAVVYPKATGSITTTASTFQSR